MLITNELIFMTTVFLCLNSSRTLLQPYIAQGLVVPNCLLKMAVEFGWQCIIEQYERDQERAQQNLSRRVPGLKYNFVHRDNWTRLNVLPAKIMQVRTQIIPLTNSVLVLEG